MSTSHRTNSLFQEGLAMSSYSIKSPLRSGLLATARKLLTFLIALAAVAIVNASPAQAFGCRGWPQLSGGNGCNSSITPPASYTGPGDVASGASFWASCARVYTAAQASTATSLCDLVAVTGGAAVCTLRGSSTGFVDLAASYCAGTTPAAACAAAAGGSCRVSKLYDQTGNGLHPLQATLANMSDLAFSALNGLPALTFAGVSQAMVTAGSITSTGEPFAISRVSNRTGAFTAFGIVLGTADTPGTSPVEVGYTSATNTVYQYNNHSVPTATASDSAFHAIQDTFNNAGGTSAFYIDGTSTSATLGANTLAINNAIHVGSNFGGSGFFTGQLAEVGIWPVDFTVSSRQSNMNTNQHSAANGYNF
jgi:hypothetical protein